MELQREQETLCNFLEDIKKTAKEPLDCIQKEVTEIRTELASVKSKIDDNHDAESKPRTPTRLPKVLTVNSLQ